MPQTEELRARRWREKSAHNHSVDSLIGRLEQRFE
jgi:hypothetical protein